MARQPSKNLYLYLALACFLGIVLIFFFDGYLGVYDSLKADNGSYTQEVPTEQWQNPDRYGGPFSMTIDENGYLDFSYSVDNRRFVRTDGEVTVTLTDSAGATRELLQEGFDIGAFSHRDATWTLKGTDVVPAGAAPTTAFNVHLTIQFDSVTREIVIYVNRNGSIPKAVPVPE